MKKKVQNTISMVLVLCMFMANFAVTQAAAIEPRYTGIYDLATTLIISTQGKATCRGEVDVKSGYTANLTVELKQDGTTIKTWTNSGSGVLTAGSTYYVMSGHTYVVTTSAVIYDANNNVVETPSKNSPSTSY